MRKSTRTNDYEVKLKRSKPNEDEVATTLCNTFLNTELANCTCSAINKTANLILLYGLKQIGRDDQNTRYYRCNCDERHYIESEGYCLTIFTIEGYYVTTKMNKSFIQNANYNSALFSDHIIMLNLGYMKLLILNDYATKFQSFPCETNFACFDENGDIYTNNGRGGITVFSQELMFKRHLFFNLHNRTIIDSFIITGDTINLLTHRTYSGYSRSQCVVHIYHLSRMIYSESIEFVQHSLHGVDNIRIDGFKNIVVNDVTGIVVLPYRGTFQSLQFDDGEICNCIHLTEDSQLIRILHHGKVQILQIMIHI